MFVLFGRKSKVKTVRGGRKVVAECPSCGLTAQFHECEKESSLNLYVVLDLFSEKTTVFRCTSCGDVFELDEQATAARPRDEVRAHSQNVASSASETPRQRARRERDERREAERLRREQERDARAREILRQRKQERKKQQIEDELAALKRKLHK